MLSFLELQMRVAVSPAREPLKCRHHTVHAVLNNQEQVLPSLPNIGEGDHGLNIDLWALIKVKPYQHLSTTYDRMGKVSFFFIILHHVVSSLPYWSKIPIWFQLRSKTCWSFLPAPRSVPWHCAEILGPICPCWKPCDTQHCVTQLKCIICTVGWLTLSCPLPCELCLQCISCLDLEIESYNLCLFEQGKKVCQCGDVIQLDSFHRTFTCFSNCLKVKEVTLSHLIGICFHLL